MSDHEDDTTPLEYFVTGLIVLLFGLLYWFLNHSTGFGAAPLDQPVLAVESSTTPPVTDDFAKTLSEKAPVETKKSKPEAEPETEGKTLALKQSDEADAKQANAERLLAEEAASKQSETERVARKKAEEQLRAEQAARKRAEEQLKVEQAARKKAEAQLKAEETELQPVISKRQNFMLPDGTEVMVPDEGFEGAVKNAMVKRIINEPLIFDAISFESGSARLNASSQDQIRAVAALMNTYKNINVLIRGHTDNVGNVNNNSLLSLTRSGSMRKELVSLGIDAGRVKIEGVGPLESVASNDTEEGRHMNRRIELILIE